MSRIAYCVRNEYAIRNTAKLEGTMKSHTYIPGIRTLKGAILIVGMVGALGIGLVTALSAYGATTLQAKGDITGSATVNGQGAAGIDVELRQRANGGDDKLLTAA